MAQRQRRSQSATVRRRSRRKPFLKDDSYAREWEREIILRDCRAMTAGGDMAISARRLRLFAPMRYSRHLQRALGRLVHEGYLRPLGRGGRYSTALTYRLPTAEERERISALAAARRSAAA